MIYSICIMKIFLKLDIKRNYFPLANLTFYIYLFHTWIYLWIFTWIEKVIHLKPIFMIILITLLTFLLSTLISIVYTWIWKNIESIFVKKNRNS